jgi:hypothetical protein
MPIKKSRGPHVAAAATPTAMIGGQEPRKLIIVQCSISSFSSAHLTKMRVSTLM